MASDAKDFKGPIVITARVEAQPGKADELAQWLANLKARANSDEEPGILLYEIVRFGDEFASFEKYKDQEAILAHTEGNPLFRDFSKIMGTLVKQGAPTFWPDNSLPEPTVKF